MARVGRVLGAVEQETIERSARARFDAGKLLLEPRVEPAFKAYAMRLLEQLPELGHGASLPSRVWPVDLAPLRLQRTERRAIERAFEIMGVQPWIKVVCVDGCCCYRGERRDGALFAGACRGATSSSTASGASQQRHAVYASRAAAVYDAELTRERRHPRWAG